MFRFHAQSLALVGALLLGGMSPSLMPIALAEDSPDLSGVIPRFTGEYATDSYAQRGDGYDFVTVTIEPASEVSAYIRVRSRGDRPRPSCSYDGLAWIRDAQTLEAQSLDTKFTLSLDDDDALIIVPSDPANDQGLFYCCSGGATLADRYERVAEGLDQTLIQQNAFERSVSLQGINFAISSLNDAPSNAVLIRPSGLTGSNELFLARLDGLVTEVEVEDMNSDGWPEVLIYGQSMDPAQTGTALGFTVFSGNSMGAIFFPPLADNPDASRGYRGHDEFRIIETTLAHRFPIYTDDPENPDPIGTRQLTYRLVDGEAGRAFELVGSEDMDVLPPS